MAALGPGSQVFLNRVCDLRLRCDRGVQRSIEDRAPARHGGQVLVARFPRSITQEAVLLHLSGARQPHGGVHVCEPVAEHGTGQPEEVMRLPELSDTGPLPPLKDLLCGPVFERPHVASVEHDHIVGAASEDQRGGVAAHPAIPAPSTMTRTDTACRKSKAVVIV